MLIKRNQTVGDVASNICQSTARPQYIARHNIIGCRSARETNVQNICVDEIATNICKALLSAARRREGDVHRPLAGQAFDLAAEVVAVCQEHSSTSPAISGTLSWDRRWVVAGFH